MATERDPTAHGQKAPSRPQRFALGTASSDTGVAVVVLGWIGNDRHLGSAGPDNYGRARPGRPPFERRVAPRVDGRRRLGVSEHICVQLRSRRCSRGSLLRATHECGGQHLRCVGIVVCIVARGTGKCVAAGPGWRGGRRVPAHRGMALRDARRPLGEAPSRGLRSG